MNHPAPSSRTAAADVAALLAPIGTGQSNVALISGILTSQGLLIDRLQLRQGDALTAPAGQQQAAASLFAVYLGLDPVTAPKQLGDYLRIAHDAAVGGRYQIRFDAGTATVSAIVLREAHLGIIQLASSANAEEQHGAAARSA